jgi:hypothetical protein
LGDKSASGAFRVGNMNLSLLPIGRNALAVINPRVGLAPALSQVAGHIQRSGTLQRDALSAVASLVAYLLRTFRRGLSSSADRTVVKLLSQSEISLEVSL